jgi:hypothetical protein
MYSSASRTFSDICSRMALPLSAAAAAALAAPWLHPPPPTRCPLWQMRRPATTATFVRRDTSRRTESVTTVMVWSSEDALEEEEEEDWTDSDFSEVFSTAGLGRTRGQQVPATKSSTSSSFREKKPPLMPRSPTTLGTPVASSKSDTMIAESQNVSKQRSPFQFFLCWTYTCLASS